VREAAALPLPPGMPHVLLLLLLLLLLVRVCFGLCPGAELPGRDGYNASARPTL
jgi:hypothetical protein